MGLGSFLNEVGSDALKVVETGGSIIKNAVTPKFLEDPNAKPDPLQRAINNTVNPAIKSTVETASQALNWVYSNGISQPISTALMAGELPGGPFKASNWSTAWHAAAHISPGQALFLGSNFYGQDPNGKASTEKAVNSPLDYYKPNSAQLPPGFDQLPQDQQRQILKDAGMPATGNAYVNELRASNSFFSNASGTADFALRWEGDPMVIAGANLAKARRMSQVVQRPADGFAASQIDKIMAKSNMGKAIDFIYQNRDSPQLLNNLSLAKNSALGPRFGAIASLLKTPDEVHDFLRVGLGDVSAIESLQSKNMLAASRIEQDTSRLSALDLMHTRYANVGNAQMTTLVQDQMARLNDRVNADESLVTRYNQVLDHAHELDQVNLTKWSFARAQQATDAQAGYRAAAARGGKAGRSVSITPTPIFSRGTATPVGLGFQKSRIYGVGDFFSSPVTVVRSFANARPNGYMRIDDIDQTSIAELRGQIARIPGISDQARLNMVNEYLKTGSEGERLALLKQIGATGAAKVAEKHGLDPQMGLDIYQEHLKRQFGEIDNMKRYSAANKPITLPDGTLASVKVDEFATDGGKLVVHPNLVTRLANDHVFQDLGEMDKVLARNASSFKAIRTSKLGNPDWMLDRADQLTSLFKFGTLFRLGYIPRVAGDDLAGQVARLGAANMALRAGWGIKNGATNTALRFTRPMAAARAATAQQGVDFATEKMAALRAEIDPLQAQIAGRRAATRADLTQAGRRLAAAQAKRTAMDPAVTPAAKVAAMDTLIAKHQLAMDRASRSMSTGVGAKNIKLQDLQAHHGWLDRMRTLQQKVVDDSTAEANAPKVIQGSKPVVLPNGAVAPAAFQGDEGQYFQKMISSDEVLGQIFKTNKALVHGHLMRSFDHGGKAISPAQDETLHATSWAHAINSQLVQDPLASLAVKGASPEDMAKWLKSTAEGRQYQRRIGLTPSAAAGSTANRVVANPEDLANAAWHDVAEYMPTPEIRAKALEPGGVTPEFLKESTPMAQRPDVHTGQVGGTQSKFKGALNDVMSAWFKWAASKPADRLSRHPLFNQFYEDHLQALAGQLQKQGAFDTTVAGVDRMATTARRLALRDTRKLVFDIAHRSDASAALRFVSPFMSATNESFQRWGRIIADRPQVVGYANNFYNAPIAMGGLNVAGTHFNGMQDADGNQIDRNGYSYTIDQKTGKAVKRLVPKSERFIVGRLPRALVDSRLGKYTIGAAFGIEPASGNFKLSQNSMDLVTQGDPWFHPGVGPIVQIPVNMLVKDKPKQAELARQLGILPFGPQNGGNFGTGPLGEAASFFMPSTIKNFLTSFDTSDERYQSIKLQIMQRSAYEHDQLGKPMPSASQIASMTRDYWLFSAVTSFMQPMATQKKDAYQFFRDQYNALRKIDPMTADDEYLKRYQESHFIFAQAQSKNLSGIPATNKAVELSKKYADLITANPELGALIVGPEGNGPFSPEAYSYQLNTPITPGSAEMQRGKMSASDAMAENKRRLGWSKYTAAMNGLTAELHNRGLKTFAAKGAADLKASKTAIGRLYGSPTLPDGSANPFYNDAWSKDFNTLDPLKYERLMPGMEKVANSPMANEPSRSDLRVLQQYLGYRQSVTQTLATRKKAGGSAVITSKSNADLLQTWQTAVDSLIESNTSFGDLHSRYLARDLGYDASASDLQAAA